MSTVDPTLTTAYNLTVANNPITFGSGTDINVASGGDGVVGGADTSWNVTNAGTIAATGTNSIGIMLAWGGMLRNQSGGTISGGDRGVYIFGGLGKVTNAGTISGHGEGIKLAGSGAVTNQAGAKISAPGGGVSIFGGAGTVSNAGSIVGGVWLQSVATVTNLTGGTIRGGASDGGYGVGLHGGGSVTNAGSIIGKYLGVEVDAGGTVTNQKGGAIGGRDIAVVLGAPGVQTRGGGDLTNAAGGTISSEGGVVAGVSAATVTNAGAITGATVGTLSKHGVTLSLGDGVQLNAGGAVTNQKGGAITGARRGVFITGGAGTVIDAGKISGARGAVVFADSGENALTLQTGAVLTGAAIGSKAAGATNALVLQGKGTTKTAFLDFNTLSVMNGAAWALDAAEKIGATTVSGGRLTVSATLTSALTLTHGGIARFTTAFAGETTFKGLGELELTKPHAATISGFATGDEIDFLSVKYAVGDKVKISGSAVTIDSAAGKAVASFKVSGAYKASEFKLGGDTTGHLLVTSLAAATLPAATDLPCAALADLLRSNAAPQAALTGATESFGAASPIDLGLALQL